jgi:hypothetical protein
MYNTSSGVGSESASMDFSSEKKPQFLYINVFFNDFKVAALVDSGITSHFAEI